MTITAKAHNPAAVSSLATVTSTVSIVSAPSGVALGGVVMAGSKPVSGARVYLYAAGTTGYSSAASSLTISGTSTFVSTNTSGAFTIPAGYSCPKQTSLMYLVALTGNAGAGINPNLSLMTALGPCSNLNSAASIQVNEATTVGAVWALAPFMSDYAHVGASSKNSTAGLLNAFLNANNLVNVTTGLPLATTLGGNGSVPRSEIDTLADILYSCTSTAGGAVGDGSPCGALFNDANPGQIASSAPVDTVQAALNIAQAPYNNTSPGPNSIYSLLPATQQYTPVLAAAPNDWTIAFSLTGGGLGTRSAAAGIAVDAQGNIWITNQRFSSVTQFSPLGAALSPTGTGNTQVTAGGYQGGGLSLPAVIAIDPLGNAWVANNSSLTEIASSTPYTYSATLPGSSFTGGGLGSPVKGLAIDGPGNIWVVTGGSPGALSWFAGANAVINGNNTAPGTPLSPATGYTQGINTPTGAIGVDTAGTVWLLNSGNDTAAEYNSATGSFIQTDYGYTEVVPAPINSVLSSGVGNTLSIDNPGNVFLSNNAQLVELKAGGSQATSGGLGSASAGNGDTYSQFLSLDGSTHFWLLITGGSNVCASQYSVVELDGAGNQLNTNATGCGYVAPGVGGTDVAVAVDGSGDLWVLSTGSVTELVGVAAPVVAPFALGVANKTLGQKP